MRSARLANWLASSLKDLQHGIVLFRRDAGFSTVMVLVLAAWDWRQRNYIHAAQQFELELLVAGYEFGSIEIESAKPDAWLKRATPVTSSCS